MSGSDPLENDIGVEVNLAAADLVICQTGCLSHDACWRVQDHCKRIGDACVVAAQPDAVRVVRIHRMPPCKDSTLMPAMDDALVVSASASSPISSGADV